MMARISNAKIWGGTFQTEETANVMAWQENSLGMYEEYKGCRFDQIISEEGKSDAGEGGKQIGPR